MERNPPTLPKLGSESKIILSGGGDQHKSLALDGFFFGKIPKNGTILYIPIALRGHRLFEGAESWFKSITTLHNRNDIRVETMTDLSADISLENFDAIYIGGGNTWNLWKEIKDYHFDEFIFSFLSLKNKILYGGSAGAIICGNDISCQSDTKEIDTDTTGLQLLGGYSVSCHYEDNRKEFVKSWHSEKGDDVIALSEDGGIIFNEEFKIERIFGVGHYIFADNNTQASI